MDNLKENKKYDFRTIKFDYVLFSIDMGILICVGWLIYLGLGV